MTTILSTIKQTKVEEVGAAKKKSPVTALINLIDELNQPTRNFIAGLMQNQLAIIAEIKKASPSQGIIRADFDVASIAQIYEAHGASCLSVLTDTPYFQGLPENIAIAKVHSTLPILRKDFIIDEYQIYESRTLGADCILLIVALLDEKQLIDYCTLAQELGMAVLVESHTREEFERALVLPTPLMGVNNRDLHTFKTNIDTSLELSQLLPADKTLISESGINTSKDIQYLQTHHIHKFLIGESLMRTPDIGSKLDAFLIDKRFAKN